MKKVNDYTLVRDRSVALNFQLCNNISNSAFRVANFIWTLNGNNELSPLTYYSRHMKEYTDDGKVLRGAIGPRMLNWVGAGQLQDAIDKNLNVDQPEDFVKPCGINQLKSVFDDLSNGQNASSIILRDPALDFDVTNNIPDLMCIGFTKDGGALHVNAVYELIELHDNSINEFWFLLQLAEIMRGWLVCDDVCVTISSFCQFENLDINTVQLLNTDKQNFNGHLYVFDPDPNEFWKDFRKLSNLENHIRQRFTGQVFENDAVSVEYMKDQLHEHFIDPMSILYMRDMAETLMIFALSKYKIICEDYIHSCLCNMGNGMVLEVAHDLSLKVGWNERTENLISDIIK